MGLFEDVAALSSLKTAKDAKDEDGKVDVSKMEQFVMMISCSSKMPLIVGDIINDRCKKEGLVPISICKVGDSFGAENYAVVVRRI